MENEPTVFVVDDDPATRDLVAALAESKGMAAEVYASAEQFLNHFEPSQYGCLVVGVQMAGISGLELQEHLRAEGIALPVIVLAALGDVPTAVRAMQGGAVTFLEKPYWNRELWESIREALDRHRQYCEQQMRQAELQARLARLTPQEHRVMQGMLVGKPNKVIAAELQLSAKTVGTRRCSVMKKMEVGSLVELARMNVEAKEYSEDAA